MDKKNSNGNSSNGTSNGSNGNASQSWVKLNVGGKIFLTTKTTLTKDPDSFLARLAREDPDLPSDKVRNLKSFFKHCLYSPSFLSMKCVFFLFPSNFLHLMLTSSFPSWKCV